MTKVSGSRGKEGGKKDIKLKGGFGGKIRGLATLKADEVAAHKDCKGRFLDTIPEEFSPSSKVPF